MARTKNRAAASRQQYFSTKVQKIYRMGEYIRLSEESERSGSNSIENQKALLERYIQEHSDLVHHAYYIDDGFTGTNFNRMAFERMMDDVRNGMIDGIIVKDISRFGREHLEVGDYIEKVFPFLGVRFISVMDYYDSDEPESNREKLILSLKSLVHELYPKDLSKKISASARVKIRRGECFGRATVAYGLRVHAGDKIPSLDYRAAKIIRKIAGWFLGGTSIQTIIIKLHNRRIYPPKQYFETGKIYGDKGTEVKFWARNSIRTILENVEYTGARVTHKTEQSLYHGIEKHEVSEEEHFVMEGILPVILRKEVFDKIQAELKRRQSEYCRQSDESIGLWESYEKNLFSGLFYCGDCGASMGRRNRLIQIDGKSYNTKVFYCRSHMNTSKECDGKTIKERELSEILVKAFQVQLRQVQELEQKLTTMCGGSFSYKISEVKEKIYYTDRKLTQLDTERICQYMDYQEGRLTQEQFKCLRMKLEYEKSNLISEREIMEVQLEHIQQAEQQLSAITKSLFLYEDQLFHAKKAEYERLTYEMIHVFTEKIMLFKDRRIKIVFRYEDVIQELYRQLAEDGKVAI